VYPTGAQCLELRAQPKFEYNLIGLSRFCGSFFFYFMCYSKLSLTAAWGC